MERNGMEWNGMYLSKGKEWEKKGIEWNGIKITLIGCFKIKEWKWIKMNEI